jgi:hypothetical protein
LSFAFGKNTAQQRALGVVLRRLRKAAGLSGPVLARRLGVSQSQLSRVELRRPRRVAVKAVGEQARVVVKTCRGEVWMSITSPFTWEAIMEPAKVDELIPCAEAGPG